MFEIRGHRHQPEAKLVVTGARRLAAVWPAEQGEHGEPTLARPTAEVGGVDAVVELLAAVEAEDPTAYRERHRLSVVALRALAAHCRAAILQAAARVDGDLTPEAVLTEVHAALRSPIDPAVERLAS